MRKPSEAETEEDWDWLKLHQRWCAAGLDPDAYWDQPPRLVRSALAGHLDRVKREQLMLLEISWHNARWSSFSEKLDPLGDVLRQAKGEEEDPEIAWHRMKMWAAAYAQTVQE